jgi:signal transduction histidine kinase
MEAIARACHELRGPLTAARLGLQLGDRTGELSRDRLRAIDLELGRAALALEDLGGVRPRHRADRADASRASGLPLVDVRALLADSVEAWTASAQAQGVKLDARWAGCGTCVRGDRLRIAQATGNLIANAIEHGGGAVGGGGAVEVHGRGGPAGVRIEVLDNGPGLPAPVGELARRAGRGRGPRGRGLAIALAVAQSHGGWLAAAPSEHSARLVLELPAAVPVSPLRPAPEGRGGVGA